MSTFKPEEYFSEYHFFEQLDINKEYTKGPFTAKYGNNEESTYEYGLYTLNGNLKYVVAKEVLSQEQLKELAKYCRCSYHTASRFNPFRYFICQCCVGCLHSSFPQQWVINESRKYRDKQKR